VQHAREAEDRVAELLNLSMLGRSYRRLGRHRLGELYGEQALRLARQLREPSYERLALAFLA
jgi:hypothetical protein